MLLPSIPRPLALLAVRQLAAVDYNVANRVTEDVASVVAWAFDHDLPFVARAAVDLLARFDEAGSVLIAVVAWMLHHTP